MAVAVLGYIAKSNKGLGIAFGAHSLHDFCIKMFLIYTHFYIVSASMSLSFDLCFT